MIRKTTLSVLLGLFLGSQVVEARDYNWNYKKAVFNPNEITYSYNTLEYYNFFNPDERTLEVRGNVNHAEFARKNLDLKNYFEAFDNIVEVKIRSDLFREEIPVGSTINF